MYPIDDHLNRLAALADPVRRDLYRWVCAQDAPVTRDEVAAGTGVARHVAKFNLDRLVTDGFLDADYRRPPGVGGPGAGRPAKVYRRSSAEVAASVPERKYELAGRLLTRAITESRRTRRPIEDCIVSVADAEGRVLGAATPSRRRATMKGIAIALAAEGYEPRVGHAGITLTNCPFHALAQEDTELVCGMNLAFIRGIVEGAEAEGIDVVLEPHERNCCVRVVRH